MLHARPARIEDADSMAPRLREADRREVRASGGLGPLEALRSSLMVSDLAIAIVEPDDTVVGLAGTAPTERPQVGAVWMLATDDLLKHRIQFARGCRKWVEVFHTRYPILWNYVDSRNAVHIRWLQWCRFTFIRRLEAYGHEGLPFLEFVRIKLDV